MVNIKNLEQGIIKYLHACDRTDEGNSANS